MQIKDKKHLLKRLLYYFFGFLPLIITLFLYTYIPNQVPSHYSVVGDNVSWSNKGQVLITPFLLTVFTYFKPKLFAEDFKSESENKVSFNSTMLFILSINILSYFELMSAFIGEKLLNKFNFYNLLSCMLCILFIILGYAFSNCTRNCTFCIKIPKHLMSDSIFKKIHYNLGVYLSSSSIVFLPIGAICGNKYIFPVLALEIFFILILPLFVTYFYAKKHRL